MPKYTDSTRPYRAGALLAAALLMAGCAQTPERSAPAPMPAAPAPDPGPAPVAYEEAPAPAPQPLVGLREDAPLRYVVKPGDTLWHIANRYLLEPWLWPEIWYVNDQVRNPHQIYPGDVLTLVWRDGRPAVLRADLEVEQLSPRVREIPLEQAIPTIPIDAIRDFLRRPRVVSAERLREAPYVLGFADPHLIEGAGTEVYVRNMPESEAWRYDGVRLGQKFIDPETRELLGWEAIPVADMEVRRHGKPATVLIARSYRETRAGDRLIEPESLSFDSNFYPRSPDHEVAARIISVFDGVSQIGQYQVVTLSRGETDGLQPGHVLTVYQTGRSTRDPYTGQRAELPELRAGTVMLFKVEERVSHALVMDAQREIHVYDRARTPGSD